MRLLKYSGRGTRLEFFLWSAVSFALAFGVNMLSYWNLRDTAIEEADGASLSPGADVLLLLLLLSSFAIVVLAGIRRLHDLDRTGWWSIGFFVPLFNLALWAGLVSRAGTNGPNRFGLDANDATGPFSAQPSDD